MIGLTGAVIVSVYSTESSVNSGFMVQRTIPATAVIFSQSNINVPDTTSRQSVSSVVGGSCNRPVFEQGQHVKTSIRFEKWPMHQTVKHVAPSQLKSPAETAIRRWSTLLSSVSKRSSLIKAKAWQYVGLACLFPKLFRPFNPIFQQIRCKLGLKEDEFMEAPSYDTISCSDSNIEEKEITMEKEIPDLKTVNFQVRTYSDCFPDEAKVMFGARILIKLVDDLPCNDPKFESKCQELFEQQQVIFAEDCADPRLETYSLFADTNIISYNYLVESIQ